MIEITREPGSITIQGHAQYAPSGADIVCAGVSALAFALIGSRGCKPGGDIMFYTKRSRNGHAGKPCLCAPSEADAGICRRNVLY